ncbi:MAG: hypothetical protein K6U00_07990 [Armatimonadetes bacterium]|nr:hypothetical protein [Armatimonadota bacterium]
MDRWLPRLVLIAASGTLLLSMILSPAIRAANPRNADVLTQVLGGTTELVAEKAYREADVYFHAGIVVPRHSRDWDGGDSHASYPVPDQRRIDLPFNSLMNYLHSQTAPKEHRHLEGAEEKEVLPWFVTAVRLNPHLIEAYSDGCYWFYRCGDTRMAEKFITEGIRRNPQSYRLYLDRGILYHRLEKWKEAAGDLERALKLWKNNSEDAPYDLRAIKTYLKDSKQRLGVPVDVVKSVSQELQKADVPAD